MKSSWNLKRFGGIVASLHGSFLIALFAVASTSLAAGAALALAVDAAFFILAGFACANLLFLALLVILAKHRAVANTARRDAEAPRGHQPTALAGAMATAVHAGESPSFIVLPAHARADEMARVLFAHQSYFPVAQGREVVGVVSKGRLLRAMAQGHGDRLIAELMNPASSARPVFAH